MRFVDINRLFDSRFMVAFLLLASGAVFPDSLKADTRTFFAFDDHGIPKQDNLQLTLIQPTKHPNNPVVPRGVKGAPDEWAVQFYGSVLHHEGKFRMWYVAADDESLELIKRGLGFSGLRPAYAESEDGIHFREPIQDFVFIPRGEEGAWDQGGLLQGQGFANVGDQTYHWYGSWDLQKPSYPPRGGVGLVTLRRDRFGYLSRHREKASAQFVTDLVEPQSATARLFVNVEGVSDTTPLRVELLDAREQPLPGYSGEKAAKVTAGGTHVAVIWASRKSGSLDSGEPFFIRAILPDDGDVRVYAVYVDRPESGG